MIVLPGRSKQTASSGPVSRRVGPAFVQPFGNVTYVSGLATPLQLLKVGTLAYIDLSFVMNVAYTQAASTAAWTAQAGFPWTTTQVASVNVGNRSLFDQNLDGYSLMLRELFQHPAYAATYSCPMPPANTGSTAVTGNEAWKWRQRLFFCWDEVDLRGLLYMAAQSASAYLQLQFAPLSSLVNIPTGSSGTLSGQVNVTGYGYAVGNLTAADLSLAHVQEAVPAGLQQGVTSAQIPLQVGEVVQRIFLQAYVSNLPDTTGQIDLSSVQVQMGISRPQQWTAGDLTFSNQLRDRSNLPAGVWVLNWADPGAAGRQYHDWSTLPQAFLNLTFGSAVPADAQMTLLYEFARGKWVG